MDNTEQQCARCLRASRDKLIIPPEVPLEFWHTEQFSEAFAAQHIGRVARVYRLNPYHHAVYGPRGISQGLLGQWLGLKQPQISRIETGPSIMNLDTLRYWAHVLRIPPERLWFDLLDQDIAGLPRSDEANEGVLSGSVLSTGLAGDARLGAALPIFLGSNLGPLRQLAGVDGEDMMKRRVFVQAATLTSFGLGGTASTLGLEVVRRELTHLVAGERATADVDDWQEIALDYGQAYVVTDPTVLSQALIADLYGLELAIQRYPDERVQRQLVQVGALLAAFMAQTVANLGNLVEARRWWRTARQAADAAGDPWAIFWIRGREVIRAGYEQRPVRVILQLVRDAEARLDEAPPEIVPEIFSGKAQALVLAGRHAEAEQALHQVRESFGKLPAPSSHNGSLFDWGEDRLRFTESFVYSHMGDFAKAEQAQQAALGLYPDSDMRGPAQIELQRALCLVRSGDLAQGTRHAQMIITSLPAMHRIRPVADLGQKVLSVIPARERRQGWAQEYRECLESSFPGQSNRTCRDVGWEYGQG